MSIVLKTSAQIRQIEENGLILRDIANRVCEYTKPGCSTKDIDTFVEQLFAEYQVIPTFKGYKGFPGHACISVNDVYVHGIPSKKHIVETGDIISIDIGVTKNGCVADSCYTYTVGPVSKSSQQLIQTAHDATMLGIEHCKPGVRLHELAKVITDFVEKDSDFAVVKGLYGHGTGIDLHEAPSISFSYPATTPNVKLVENMVITIEPVIGLKSSKGQFREDSDKWTLRSLDKTPGAQFEHTLAITSSGPKILTGEFKSLNFT